MNIDKGREASLRLKETNDSGILMVIDGGGWVGQSTRHACFSCNRCPATSNGPICYHINIRKYTEVTDSYFLFSYLSESQRPMDPQKEANQPFLEEADQKVDPR